MKDPFKRFIDIHIILFAYILMIIGKVFPFLWKPMYKFVTKVLKCDVFFYEIEK